MPLPWQGMPPVLLSWNAEGSQICRLVHEKMLEIFALIFSWSFPAPRCYPTRDWRSLSSSIHHWDSRKPALVCFTFSPTKQTWPSTERSGSVEWTDPITKRHKTGRSNLQEVGRWVTRGGNMYTLITQYILYKSWYYYVSQHVILLHSRPRMGP